ncbi:MAG: PorT family protein [Bacteroidales bacterium]|jgi:hypothetical protein|nr:PorT family protein [Bacteroidales bacterium]
MIRLFAKNHVFHNGQKWFAVLLLLAGSRFAAGQDLIVTNADDSLRCKIVEVQNEDIQFRFGSDGNLVSIKRSEVKSYKYNFEAAPVVKKSSSGTANTGNVQSRGTKSAFARDKGGISFGIRTGANIANLNRTAKVPDGVPTLKSKAGFHLGVVVDFPVSNLFSLESGLAFTGKGTSYSSSQSDNLVIDGVNVPYIVSADTKFNLSYLEIPLTANFHIHLSDKAKLHFNVGPYLAIGLVGTVDGTLKLSALGESESVSSSINVFNEPLTVLSNDLYEKMFDEPLYNDLTNTDKGDLKRLDTGLTFGGGLSFGKFYFGVQYDLGLNNMSNYPEATTIKSRTLSIRLGYNF